MSVTAEAARLLHPRLSLACAAPVDLLIARATLIDPPARSGDAADVLVRGGRIASVAAPGSIETDEAVPRIDADGMTLMPGFVDPHVHLRTPGQEHKEDLATGTGAAAAGGFCAVIVMPNTDPVVDSPSVLRALRDDADSSATVATGFLPSITVGLAGETLSPMAELRELGALGFTDDGAPVASAGVLRRACQYQRLCGGVLALHEEDPELMGRGVINEGVVSAVLGISGAPDIAESTMIARDAAIAGHESARVHIMHVSSAKSVAAVERAKEDGVSLTAEVTPHHLLFTEDNVRRLDSRFKVNPPLRTASDRAALLDALRRGAIDCVATDHAPHAPHEKEVPFERAPMGVTGLETAFSSLYTHLVLPGLLSLPTLVSRLTCAADVYGIPRPAIEVGRPANLTLVDLEREWCVGRDGYHSRSRNSPFEGETLRGRVALTLVAGQEAFRAGFCDRTDGEA